MLRLVHEVFSERNIMVLSGTNMLYQVFNSLWQLWWSLYLLEVLNTPLVIIGLLSSVQNTAQILFQLPGGMLADRIGRKKVIVLGTGLRVLGPVLLVLAPTWQWVIPGVILNSVAYLYLPAFNALIADSLPKEKRGTAFGAYRTVTSVPNIVMPIISGVFMDTLGIARGIRMGLYMYIVAASVAMLVRALFLRETLVRSGEDANYSRDMIGSDVRDLLKKFRGTLLVMLVVACISGFAMRMTYPFLVIYGVEVIGFTSTQWGALQTIAIGLSTALYLLGGVISDRYGRVPCITVARSILPLESLGVLFFHDFHSLLPVFALLGIGGGLGGGSIRGGGYMGGPAWQALIADIVPQVDRGKVMGLMATITGFINLPAPILGSYIWENLGADALLLSGSLLGFTALPLIIRFIRDPEARQE